MKNLLTKKLKEFLGGPIYPTSFDHLYIQQDQQLFIKNSCDVRGIGPNHHIQYQKVTQNDNCWSCDKVYHNLSVIVSV